MNYRRSKLTVNQIRVGESNKKIPPVVIDTRSYIWFLIAGLAKLHLNADREAVAWLRRSIEANRNHPLGQLWLAAALARLGWLDEAKAAARAAAPTANQTRAYW